MLCINKKNIKKLKNALEEQNSRMLELMNSMNNLEQELDQREKELIEQDNLIIELRQQLDSKTFGSKDLSKTLYFEKTDVENVLSFPSNYSTKNSMEEFASAMGDEQFFNEHDDESFKEFKNQNTQTLNQQILEDNFDNMQQYEPQKGDIILTIDVELIDKQPQVLVDLGEQKTKRKC